MNTRELILQAATEQFNQMGTSRVTTNHIASEAKISPGNLYYHYKDKAHIIREIYEQMMCDWESVYEQVEEDALLPDDVLRLFVRANLELLWKYRFFYRETVALLNSDALLYQRHVEVTQSRFERQRQFLQKAVQQGMLKFSDTEVEIDEVLTIAWIVANHYLIHLESMGHSVEKKDFNAGVDLVMKVLRPYQIGS